MEQNQSTYIFVFLQGFHRSLICSSFQTDTSIRQGTMPKCSASGCKWTKEATFQLICRTPSVTLGTHSLLQNASLFARQFNFNETSGVMVNQYLLGHLFVKWFKQKVQSYSGKICFHSNNQNVVFFPRSVLLFSSLLHSCWNCPFYWQLVLLPKCVQQLLTDL